jgi:FkbM family methyltransferase
VEESLVLSVPGFVRLLRQRGRDLVATRSRDQWWEFEDPLPLTVVALLDVVDGCFYDVGANTGFYSVLVGRLRSDLTVRAFEPVPEIAAHFAQNMAVNDLPIVAEQVALSDRDGTAQLFLPPDTHGLIESSASLNGSFKEEVAISIEVRCERLDTAVERLGDSRVGFVKIDVEGAEELVLAGATACLQRDRPLVAVELLPRARFDMIAALLEDHDYRLLSLRPGLVVEQEDIPRFIDDSWNQLLVPAERIDDVIRRLDKAAAAGACDRAELTARERLLWDTVAAGHRAAQAEHDDLAELVEAAWRERDEAIRERDDLAELVEAAWRERDEVIRERDAARTACDELRATADDAELRIAELLRSTSWRATAPFRKLTAAVARRPR